MYFNGLFEKPWCLCMGITEIKIKQMEKSDPLFYPSYYPFLKQIRMNRRGSLKLLEIHRYSWRRTISFSPPFDISLRIIYPSFSWRTLFVPPTWYSSLSSLRLVVPTQGFSRTTLIMIPSLMIPEVQGNHRIMIHRTKDVTWSLGRKS